LLRRLALLLLFAPLACSDEPTGPGDGSARSTADRADAVSAAQVHVVYALPADRSDRGLDSTGVLEFVSFLQDTWDINVADEELLPENFDSIDNLTAFVMRKSR
jgi:hypothetical protein